MEVNDKIKAEIAELQKSLHDISEAVVCYMVMRGAIDQLIAKYAEEKEEGNGWGEACREHEQDLTELLKAIDKLNEE